MRRLVTGLTAAGAAAVLLAPPGPAEADGLPMTVTTLPRASSLASYPVYDPAGNLLRHDTYRVTMTGGNCCEKYVAATPSGRLLELGGSYPLYSDDDGVTWHELRTAVPIVTGEGAISAAPGGDVVGLGWDAYSGDRLLAFKYSAATGRWTYLENPVHLTGFDRPWITVVEGPFQIGTTTVPWISIARGGISSGRDVELVSYDGLTYAEPSATTSVAALLASRPGPLPVVTDPDTDSLQPHSKSRVSPLPGGGAIRRQEGGVLCSTRLQVMNADRSWSCLSLPGQQFTGDVRADSRGWLHEARYGGSTVTYRVSTDGGTTWAQTVLPLPGGAAASVTGTGGDLKVDSVRSRTYLALRVNGAGTGGQQDLVVRFDHAGGVPSATEISYVGRGDVVAGIGLGAAGARFDFISLALLPDGRFVVTYDDSTTQFGSSLRPGMAILQ